MRWQSISGEVPENISADSPLVFLIRIIGRVPAEMHVPDSLEYLFSLDLVQVRAVPQKQWFLCPASDPGISA